MQAHRASGDAAQRRKFWVECAAFVALLASCQKGGASETVITESREHETVGRPIQWGATDAQRFGVSAKDFGGMGGGDESAPMQGAPAYELPAGWIALPPAQFREINVRVAGDPNAECYMTTLGGGGGGLEPNVNRWRAQVSLPPISGAEIAALPTMTWFGAPATLVDVEGEWTGMSGDQSSKDWRLVGLLLIQGDRARFLKMTGPRDVIAREYDNFKAFVASFGAAGAAPSTASAPQAAPPKKAEPGALPMGDGKFAWTGPSGWKLGPDKAMRDVTYVSGAGDAVECYLSQLTGTGGGLLANVNRWCGQMGAAPLDEGALAKLGTVPMLGVDAVVVELPRGEGATAPAHQELLIGAVCMLPTRSVFVKMVGPRAEVELQREAFLEFCRSIRPQG